MGRERRRRTRRSTSSTSSTPAAGSSTPPVAGATVPPSTVPSTRPAVRTQPVQVRSDRVLAREASMMISEIKRVALVSGVCFGMLAVLVVVDRLQ